MSHPARSIRERNSGRKKKTKKPKRRQVWYEDYHDCHCTNIQDARHELPGHCSLHLKKYKTRMQIPDMGFERGPCGAR